MEFEPSADDIQVSDSGRLRTIITALLPNAPESVHLFRTVYELLEPPLKEAFHYLLGDCKAIALITGNDIGINDVCRSVCVHLSLFVEHTQLPTQH